MSQTTTYTIAATFFGEIQYANCITDEDLEAAFDDFVMQEVSAERARLISIGDDTRIFAPVCKAH